MSKKAVVLHSGGMDSSLSLHLACKKFSKDNVIALHFDYNQRHKKELEAAQKIAESWGVESYVTKIFEDQFAPWQESALVDEEKEIRVIEGKPPTTFVVGRNGLFLHVGGAWAHHFGADMLVTGVMGLDEANSGYPDCSLQYMKLMESVIRLDLGRDNFSIWAPLMEHDKISSLALADKEGVLPFLLEETVTCYRGIKKEGCKECPSCQLRNDGLSRYFAEK